MPLAFINSDSSIPEIPTKFTFPMVSAKSGETKTNKM